MDFETCSSTNSSREQDDEEDSSSQDDNVEEELSNSTTNSDSDQNDIPQFSQFKSRYKRTPIKKKMHRIREENEDLDRYLEEGTNSLSTNTTAIQERRLQVKQLKKLTKQRLRGSRSNIQDDGQQIAPIPAGAAMWGPTKLKHRRRTGNFVPARGQKMQIGGLSDSSVPPELTGLYRIKPKLSVHKRCQQWLELHNPIEYTPRNKTKETHHRSHQQYKSPSEISFDQFKRKYKHLTNQITRNKPRDHPANQCSHRHPYQKHKEDTNTRYLKINKNKHPQTYKYYKNKFLKRYLKRQANKHLESPADKEETRVKSFLGKVKKYQNDFGKTPKLTAGGGIARKRYKPIGENDACTRCQFGYYKGKLKNKRMDTKLYARKYRPGLFISKKRKPVTPGWVVLQAVNMLEATNTACPNLILRTIRQKLGKPNFTIQEVKTTLNWMARKKILNVKRRNGTNIYTTRDVRRGRNKRKMKTARSVYHTNGGKFQRIEFPTYDGMETDNYDSCSVI